MPNLHCPKMLTGSLLFLCALISVSCQKTKVDPSTSTTVQLFAAAGTRRATEALCDRYEAAGHAKVQRNFASSGTLARQIAAGASADVFVSANKQWIDYLNEKGMLRTGSIQKIAGNALVVVAPKGAAKTVPVFEPEFDIVSAIDDKIVIGDPSFVPVGKYAKAVFDRLGWFDKLKRKMILAKDVSSALNYVALGTVDWGIVYRSEALASDRVEIIAEIPSGLHPPIEFFIADTKTEKPPARALSALFRGEEGLAVFLKHGFLDTRLAGAEGDR